VERPEPRADLPDGPVLADRLQTVRAAAKGMKQAFRVVHVVPHVHPSDARVALRDRMLAIRAYGNDPVVFDLDDEPAEGLAGAE
jgi:hypothetical protein